MEQQEMTMQNRIRKLEVDRMKTLNKIAQT